MNLKDIEARLAEIEQGLLQLENKKPVIERALEEKREAWTSAQETADRLDERMYEEIHKIRERFSPEIQHWLDQCDAIKQEGHELKSSLEDILSQLRKLAHEKDQLLEDIGAYKHLEQLAERLREFFDGSIWGKLAKDYQREDILAIVHAYETGETGVMNANVMGAGKTAETVAAMSINQALFARKLGRRPTVLVLTKKTLMDKIAREIRKWEPDQLIFKMNGKVDKNFGLDMALANGAWVLTNYEQTWAFPRLAEIEWDFIMADEIHASGIKSGSSKTFDGMKELLGVKEASGYGLAEKTKKTFFVPMTGTPFENKASEIWPSLFLFKPDRFPSVYRFEREFCRQEYDSARGKFVFKPNQERLLKAFPGLIIRQSPERVYAEQPDKYREFHYVQLTPKQREGYNEIRDKYLLTLKKKAEDDPTQKISVGAEIAAWNRMRQFVLWPPSIIVNGNPVDPAESAKLDYAIEEIITPLVENEKEQVIVWSAQFKGPLYELNDRLVKLGYKVAMMTGDNNDEHDAIEELWRAGELQVLLANRQSAGLGANLHKNPSEWAGGARHAIMLDLWWNPRANEQMEDRIWGRVGVKESVFIHILHAEDTVDNLVAKINEAKDEDFYSVFGNEKSTLTPSEMISFLEDLI